MPIKNLPSGLTTESITHFIPSFRMGGKVYCDELGSYYGLLFPQTGNFLCVYPTYFYFWGITFICISTQCSYKHLQALQNIKWGSALLHFCSPVIFVWSKDNFRKTAAKKKKKKKVSRAFFSFIIVFQTWNYSLQKMTRGIMAEGKY